MDFKIYKNDSEEVLWDTEMVEFLNDPAPDTVNPSLWRNSQLQSIPGLFKVVDGVYQVRGISISTTVLIEGETGLIVCDTLKSIESAKAAMELYYQHRPKKTGYSNHHKSKSCGSFWWHSSGTGICGKTECPHYRSTTLYKKKQ
ncbi:hypothetical protein RCO48_33100 [Peribacillus frigoritolerans]|nr:hypothetical protein [Peribacillus frigoritolerans]